jgi:hypothetical protein
VTGTPPASPRSALEAGAGRPFRFSLVLEDGRGRLAYWLGGKWAILLGLFVLAAFVALGATLSALLDGSGAHPLAPVCAAAAVGAAAVALHLRTRTVLFERRGDHWSWRERGNPARLRWTEITEDRPLRMEREILSTVEGWTLYAGSVRLFSYLGDPSIARRVQGAFQEAGVPLRTEMRRPPRA